MSIEMISSPWCKRCAELKPSAFITAVAAGLSLGYVNYDELEDGDLKDSVTALPTFRIKNGEIWTAYTAAQFEDWKKAVLSLAPMKTDGTDF